jgi:hypothetical protein
MSRTRRDDCGSSWGADEVRDWGFGSLPLPSPESNVTPTAPTSALRIAGDDPEPGATIPRAALLAMEDRRHHGGRPDPEDEEPETALGSGDRTLYVIGDGPDHCMIARLVGEDEDGCTYCLTARIDRDRLAQMKTEEVLIDDAFVEAKDITLSSVFEGEAAPNVVHIQHFRRPESVPVEYLPPSPFIEFTDDEEA